jgi:hypothetical protein
MSRPVSSRAALGLSEESHNLRNIDSRGLEFPLYTRGTGLRNYFAKKFPGLYRFGIAATKGYWNFNHPAFDQIKQFLQAL